jgi:UDP-N-acetylmuramate--alanine ligase
MSTYENNYENLLAKFSDFILKDSVNNIYMCIDDKGCQDLLEKYPLKSNKNVVLYGFSSQSDAQIINYHIGNDGLTNFQICYKNIKYDFAMMLPGKYNVQNATACIINCFDFGFTYADIKEALFRVKGVARRFDVYNKKILGYLITVVDDYGHHPTEVTNCLEAIRERYPDKKIIHVFQPHRYTRNRDLLDDWFHALSISDRLILLPTYSAGESVIKGAESQDIAAGLANCTFADSFDHAIYFIEKYLDKDSIILIQGAGDVTNLVEMVGE